MSTPIEWMLITADPEIARHAEKSGVHRVFVDMEVRGKQERQGHLNTHKAAHTFEDVSAVRAVLDHSELMVRVNPLYQGTQDEINRAIEHGAERLMLPMFTVPEEVLSFRQMTPDSTPITYLAETPAALARIEAWLPYLHRGDEVHFGLNDLSLAMGLDFLFEPLAGGLLDSAAAALRSAGIPFGIGGVARPNCGELPAQCVLGEHVRLGSTRVILSRAFHGSATTLAELVAQLDLPAELGQLRAIEQVWSAASVDELERNAHRLAETTFAIAAQQRRTAEGRWQIA